jgi:hypothetical protein
LDMSQALLVDFIGKKWTFGFIYVAPANAQTIR